MRYFKVIAAACGALLAAGCDLLATTYPEMAGLPSDRYERGLVCTAAIAIFSTPTATRPLTPAQAADRAEMLRSMTGRLQAAGWLKFKSAKDIAAAHNQVANVMRQQGAHFGTVNLCKKAYALGPPEAPTPLPEDADMRAATCAAAAITSRFEWYNKQTRYGEEPVAFYFLLQSALSTQDGDFSSRLGEAVSLIDDAATRLVQEGDAPEAKALCLAAYPKSAKDYVVTLPAKAAGRDAVCPVAADLVLNSDPTAPSRPDLKAVKALAARLGVSPVHYNANKALQAIVDVGPPHAVLAACLKPT